MTDRAPEEILEELLAWTKFGYRTALADQLRTVLVDAAQYRMYAATDGTHGQIEVAVAAGVSQPTVSRAWARWRRQGLVREAADRVIHLAHPEDLGLEEPG